MCTGHTHEVNFTQPITPRPREMDFFLGTAVCLAISGLYKLFKWFTAGAIGKAAAALPGTHRDE